MGFTLVDFIRELTKSDLLEMGIDSYNLSLLINETEIIITSVSNDYTALTPDGLLPLGKSLVTAGSKIKSYTDTRNKTNIFSRLLIELGKYDNYVLGDSKVYFRGFSIHYDGKYSIVAESNDGDKFYFNISDIDKDMSQMAEKINRFLK